VPPACSTRRGRGHGRLSLCHFVLEVSGPLACPEDPDPSQCVSARGRGRASWPRDRRPKSSITRRVGRPLRGDASRCRPARRRAPSSGFFWFAPPSTSSSGVHIPRTEVRFGVAVPPAMRVPSAVSHRFDSLLHRSPSGLVASRCRPWGSSSWSRAVSRPLDRPRCQALQSVPLRSSGSPRHRGALPPWRSPTCVRSEAPSRPRSGSESVAPASRCRSAAPVALLGFPALEPRVVSRRPPLSSRRAVDSPKRDHVP